MIWAGLARVPNVRRDTPTITIEFVSSQRRDRVRDYEVKRQEYGDIGVAEYWIIDPEARTVEVFVLREGAYDLLGKWGVGATAHSTLLEDFQVSVGDLFPT